MSESTFADFIAANWQSTVKCEITYQGQMLGVELAVKPSEAIIETGELPSHNNHLLAVLAKKLADDPQMRAKMNPRKIADVREVFEDDDELIGYMMKDETAVEEMMDLEQKQAQQEKEINRRIVVSCAVNPRFTDFADFTENQSNYLEAAIKTFPVEYISDFDLQQMALKATGKHLAWEVEKAKQVANFSVPEQPAGESEKPS